MTKRRRIRVQEYVGEFMMSWKDGSHCQLSLLFDDDDGRHQQQERRPQRTWESIRPLLVNTKRRRSINNNRTVVVRFDPRSSFDGSFIGKACCC